jgi:hypothetical protein
MGRNCAPENPSAATVVILLMHTREGDEFYILPRGGRVARAAAAKILQRPDIKAFDDGLIPGHSQQWRISR